MSAQEAPKERLYQALSELAEVQSLLERERLDRLAVESLFAEVLGAMSDALILTDPPGRIWRVNDAAVRLLDEAADDLVGRPIASMAGEGFPGRIWDILELDGDGRVVAREAEVLRGDGTAVPVSLSSAVVWDDAGKVIGAVYSLRDLSQTERLLQQLAVAESRWRLLAEISTDLAMSLDPRQELESVCRRVAASLRCACAIVLQEEGLRVRLGAVAGDDPAAGELEGAFRDGTAHPGTTVRSVLLRASPVHARRCPPDLPFLRPGGGSVGSAVAVPLVARRETLGLFLLATAEEGGIGQVEADIAEEVAGRIALALSNASLHDELLRLESVTQAERVREQLFSSVTHDMLTPLTVVRSAARSLAKPRRDEEERERLVAALQRQSDRLYRLLRGFLDHFRLEAGRPLAMQVRSVRLLEVVERATALFAQQRPVDVEAPPEVPRVRADPERLEQVVANLVSNAVKYSSPETPVTIGVHPNRGTVELSVTDRGVGISPQDMARVFDRFYRGPEGVSEQGLGLGLYLSKVFVEQMGGKIRVQSRVGRGSTFTVSLPIASEG